MPVLGGGGSLRAGARVGPATGCAGLLRDRYLLATYHVLLLANYAAREHCCLASTFRVTLQEVLSYA